MVNVKEQKQGVTVRKSFSKTRQTIELPNLVEIQTKSYKWFVEEGLSEVLHDVSPITDYSGNLQIDFISYTFSDQPNHTVEECKERDANYAVPLRVNVRLTNKITGEVKQTDVYVGEFPLMTENGTFVINGAERVIVSQIIRSPGMYYTSEIDKAGKRTYAAQVIPYRGAWLEYEIDPAGVMYVRIDKNRKLPLTMFIRALGIESRDAIYQMFGEDSHFLTTFEKDEVEEIAERNHSSLREEALKEIFKKLRPGEPPVVEQAEAMVTNYFFDPRRYDIAPVGRYKFNKKMAIHHRIAGHKIAHDIVSPVTGEVLFEAGHVLSTEDALTVEHAAVNEVILTLDNGFKLKFKR